ncbi:efflux RND transporter permease subunit [Staphylococcus shinii]|uniref:Efflux RND transporter permease subunit n=3 Tax=Staphylococcus TaxID=1279 RepID=A0A418IDQ2_9STAP|nr:efflux RND transporter permease subunit [Staphylococcus shinii]MDW8565628.1 efflux RND transporter permease subunit [Staphylococcus shinii]MDW8566130.1 efflux RND transporter permease subunit [Staphylococcus shinii]RIM98837.1 efflux RND transporter permease subunit [Staphylococcus shinii]RIN09924.1 efflux RND transporter permease subunit [Staphylococcus shinii]
MIKKMLQFSLGNKFAIFLMVILVVLGGLYASAKMKLELLPDVESPMITVQTSMPGATPETVKEDVSDKIDDQVRSMASVKNVTAQSIQNASMVTVEYEESVDLDKAENDLKKEIDKIKFDEGIEEPELSRNSMDAFPIVAYSFTTKDNNLKDTTNKINHQLIPKLQTIDGVQNAQLNGQTSREVSIKFNQDKLESNGLTKDSIEQYLKSATSETPLGLFQFNNTEKSVVIDGEFTSVDALKNLDIPLSVGASSGAAQSQSEGDSSDQMMQESNGQSEPQTSANAQAQSDSSSLSSQSEEAEIPSVKLKDIADVTAGDERESISKTNGKDAVNVQITKAQDANTVQVAKDTKKEIDKLIKENPDMVATKVMDTAKPIEDALYTMIEKAILGTIVAIIVILLFLRNIRTTAIAVVSIPMSILIAMVALKLSDVSLNILTLGALTVAIGRVIDDSIVVVENIYRRLSDRNESLSGDRLIVSATSEVFKPIMSSTIVTIIVFLPLAFVTGSVGEMFRPFALAIAFSLLASLLVSITIVPALSATFFKKGVKNHKEESLGFIGRKYKTILKWSLNHKWLVILISTIILIASIGLGAAKLGTSFISTGEDKFMALTYTPKPGETEKGVLNHAEQVQKYLNKKDKVKTVQYSVGGASPTDPTGSSNSMAIMVEYDSDTPNFDEEPDKVLQHIEKFKHPGEWANQDMGTGGSNNKLEVSVTGPTLEAIKGTVNKVEDEMKDVSGMANVKSDLTQTYDQYNIKVDQNEAAKYGLSASQLAMTLNQNTPEQSVTTVKEKGKSIDVKIKEDKETDWSKEKLENTKLQTPIGRTIELSDIATLEQTKTPNKIETKAGDYTATVSAKVTNDDVGGTAQKVLSKVNDLDTPTNVKINVGGANEDISNAITQLAFAMLAAIIIVYLVLVLTFKGALAPFTILFSLPYTVIGVVLALVITGETISVPSMIGMLMLIGIVVTNAIVLIDRVINKQKQGLEMKEALLEAGGTRIRPILMTALATIGALAPMLFGEDSSIIISKGMAATVVGGLISSTLLTLIVVPVIYEILFTLKDKVTRKKK